MALKRSTAAVVAGAVLTTGVAAISVAGASPATAAAAAAKADVSSQLAISVSDGQRIAPGTRVRISGPAGWKLHIVRSGLAAQALDTTGAWLSEPLAPGLKWTFAATLTDPGSGDTGAKTVRVTTASVSDPLTASLSPRSGAYGIGEIPIVTFNTAVTGRSRAVVEKALRVTSSKPVRGAWHWISDNSAAYRPKGFWPGHSKITISADLRGVSVSGTGGKVRWGTRAYTARWQTGRALVVRIDSRTHRGSIYIDGRRVQTFPTSTGKSGFTTRSGVKTIFAKYRVRRMTNQGITNDEVYDLQVPYAMQLTSSGEFLHAAPWNGQIGQANTSHGCTHMPLGTAGWLFNRIMMGDPVVTTGTGRPMELDNGPGGLWNLPWSQWAK